ncbi:hypothetical protein, partial [Paenibacillus contaminans]
MSGFRFCLITVQLNAVMRRRPAALRKLWLGMAVIMLLAALLPLPEVVNAEGLISVSAQLPVHDAASYNGGRSALPGTDRISAIITGQHAESISSVRDLTIITVPGLSFQELREPWLDEMPEIKEAIRRGAVGGVNTRLSGNRFADVYLTIGAGRPAYMTSQTNGWNRMENAGGTTAEEQMRRFRAGGAPEGEVLVPFQSRLAASNARSSYAAKPGELGELLKNSGVARYVWGNADLGGNAERGTVQRQRYAPLMAMDASGAVDYGEVGPGIVVEGSQRPFGVRANTQEIWERWQKRRNGSLSLIELGDLHRLYEEKEGYERLRFEEEKRDVLRELDALFGRIKNGLRDGEELWLFSPKGNPEAYRIFDRLSPLVVYREGKAAGLLESASTRRAGVVTMFDMSVSIARLFGAESPSEWMGSPLGTFPVSDNLMHLQKELSSIRTIYGLRPKLLYSWTLLEIVILLAALVGTVWLGKERRKSRSFTFRVLLAAVLAAPAVMLVMGWLDSMTAGAAVLSFAAVVAVSSLLLAQFNVLKMLMAAGLGTAMLILFDGWTGAEAMKRSVLGYDPLIGARYYGIGNEYMGVLIGALILGVSAWLQLRQRRSRSAAGDALAAGAAPPAPGLAAAA